MNNPVPASRSSGASQAPGPVALAPKPFGADPAGGYGWVSIVLHWATVVLLLPLWFVGYATSHPGSESVLKLIHTARAKGISVIFITHNVHHAYPIGDSFTLLNRGKSLGTFTKETISKDEVLDMMAGGAEMQKMIGELEGATI